MRALAMSPTDPSPALKVRQLLPRATPLGAAAAPGSVQIASCRAHPSMPAARMQPTNLAACEGCCGSNSWLAACDVHPHGAAMLTAAHSPHAAPMMDWLMMAACWRRRACWSSHSHMNSTKAA